MKSLEFNFYGVKALVECDADLAGKLSLDFSYFKKSPQVVFAQNIAIKITASSDASNALRLPPGKHIKFKVHDFVFFDTSGARYVEYGGRGAGRYDFSKEEGRVFSAEPGLLHELTYLMILSRVGELLDSRGAHRVHALGGSARGKGVLVVMPQGGGKTTLGLELLETPGFMLFSDDAPLVTVSGRIYPFPVRIGVNKSDKVKVPAQFLGAMQRRKFGEKTLIDVEYFKDRISAPGPCSVIIFATRSGGSLPGVRRVSALEGFWYLFKPLVLGMGVPQVVEYFIRFDFLNIMSKIKMLLSRSVAAVRLVSNARLFAVTLSGDAKTNTSFILNNIDGI